MPVTSQALVEFILLGPADDRRQLQDSPILGDVWAAFAANPSGDQDLLITPYKTQAAGPLAAEIAWRVQKLDFPREKDHEAKVAYLQGITAAHLYFPEVLRIVVPMTWWWNDVKRTAIERHRKDRKPLVRSVGAALTWARNPEGVKADEAIRKDIATLADLSGLDRYLVLAGIILVASRLGPNAASGIGDAVENITADQVVDALFELDKEITRDRRLRERGEKRRAGRPAPRSDRAAGEAARPIGPVVWQVSLNRTAAPALERSVPAVKADAARTLFSVNCADIAWAVIDSGIDAGHPVFRTADGRRSRVVETYDFTRIRDIVSLDNLDAETATDHAHKLLKDKSVGIRKAAANLLRLAKDADNDRPIYWELVEPFIKVPQATRRPDDSDPDLDNPDHLRNKPYSGHGTHVGAIIGASTAYVHKLAETAAQTADEASAQAAPMMPDYRNGLCPDIKLYDFRVLARDLKDTEFAVIAALQYIRYLNERHNFISVHGVNLSLSIPHDVRNFACGRTPICDECERLVASGVVVVAAAGNRGYNRYETKDGSYEGYTAFSITDPGNAAEVITVGATHRFWPHTYGISFFSSRGPTGDGRLKPDLVAPGERIESALPKGEWGQLDGTSMAAPHVSGAAAMLMARYSELIGQPRRIKKILCESATDLGRERTFQGHGMLDVLRAFQSI